MIINNNMICLYKFLLLTQMLTINDETFDQMR